VGVYKKKVAWASPLYLKKHHLKNIPKNLLVTFSEIVEAEKHTASLGVSHPQKKEKEKKRKGK
jgi:methionine-rich copper-binding protein CopC